jgi:hypothetical protein
MKRAAAALWAFFESVVGIEGAFLLLGTVALAVAAGYLHPSGPWWVVGGMATLVGLLLTRRPA